ncbi:MAG: FMN-binding protein [Ruminococcus sp.]|nr:FMN-binding protein [Ruminococcus sp.]
MVENGIISDVTVDSCKDDRQYFNRAKGSIISAVITSQSTEVDAVSGAAFSSNGIKEAVPDALGIEFTNPNSSASKCHGRSRSR